MKPDQSRCQRSVTLNKPTSSRLNRTPPIGAPKATDTPAAAAADNTCRSHKLFVRMTSKSNLINKQNNLNFVSAAGISF